MVLLSMMQPLLVVELDLEEVLDVDLRHVVHDVLVVEKA